MRANRKSVTVVNKMNGNEENNIPTTNSRFLDHVTLLSLLIWILDRGLLNVILAYIPLSRLS